MNWDPVRAALARSTGCSDLRLIAREPFWDEEDLPFAIAGGGAVLHVLPDPGFRKESLAATQDERLLIVDCPDAEGWLAPEGVVAQWLTRHVSCPDLDDVLLAHPLYEYLTQLDNDGFSRGGRAPLVHWMPGIPTVASLVAPEFLPEDPEAPRIHRDPMAHADAVTDLLEQLTTRFELDGIDVGIRVTLPEPRHQRR